MGRHPSNRLDPFSADRQFAPTFQFEAITTARVRRKRMHLLQIDEVGPVDSHEATRQYLRQFVQRLLMQARSEERRVGTEWSVRIALGGLRLIKKKTKNPKSYA